MNTDPFATLDDVLPRLDWELDDSEQAMAEAALEDASDLARAYGRDWDAALAPRAVRTLVLAVVCDYMRNPEGYTQSRAGDETVIWADMNNQRRSMVTFDDGQIKLLAQLAGKGGIGSAPVSAWGARLCRQRNEGYVPVSYKGGKPFPLFSNDEDNW